VLCSLLLPQYVSEAVSALASMNLSETKINYAVLCCLSLLQYVSEAVSALAEVPLKNSDVPAAVDMAAALHARCAASCILIAS
jgi:hypothetical protein